MRNLVWKPAVAVVTERFTNERDAQTLAGWIEICEKTKGFVGKLLKSKISTGPSLKLKVFDVPMNR
jgi:hypothetical protein